MNPATECTENFGEGNFKQQLNDWAQDVHSLKLMESQAIPTYRLYDSTCTYLASKVPGSCCLLYSITYTSPCELASWQVLDEQ